MDGGSLEGIPKLICYKCKDSELKTYCMHNTNIEYDDVVLGY